MEVEVKIKIEGKTLDMGSAPMITGKLLILPSNPK